MGVITEALPIPTHMKPVQSSSSSWVRAPEGGILHSLRRTGDRVGAGEEIGFVTGPLGQNPVAISSDDDGIIIGRTHLPIVNRGDALFHIARIKGRPRAVQAVPDEDEII